MEKVNGRLLQLELRQLELSQARLMDEIIEMEKLRAGENDQGDEEIEGGKRN